MPKKIKVPVSNSYVGYEDYDPFCCSATITDKDAPLQNTNPHYTDDRFKHPQTIFGAERKGIHYDYSDRLYEWDYTKAREAEKIASKSGAAPKSCKWYEAYLSAYHGKEATIYHILAGWNLSSGYSYMVFGYTLEETKKNKKGK